MDSAERLGEPIAAAGADDGYDIGALRRHPGNRRLRHADAFGAGDLAQRLDQSEVRIDVVALEARAEGAKIATGRSPFLPMAPSDTTLHPAAGPPLATPSPHR